MQSALQSAYSTQCILKYTFGERSLTQFKKCVDFESKFNINLDQQYLDAVSVCRSWHNTVTILTLDIKAGSGKLTIEPNFCLHAPNNKNILCCLTVGRIPTVRIYKNFTIYLLQNKLLLFVYKCRAELYREQSPGATSTTMMC